MAIGLTDKIEPLGAFPVLQADFVQGGYHSVATTDDRDALATHFRQAGMLVCVVADGSFWRLGSDLTTWTQFTGGGGGSFTAAGDLSGSNTSQTVIGLYGRPLPATEPDDGDILVYRKPAQVYQHEQPTGLAGWTVLPRTSVSFMGVQRGDINSSFTLCNVLNPPNSLPLETVLPVRLLDKTGVLIFNGGAETVISGAAGSFLGLTGLPQILRRSGRLYFQVFSNAGTYYINIYLGNGFGQGMQIGHTNTFNTTGDKPVIADNGSNLGGTLRVRSVGTTGYSVVEFYKWCYTNKVYWTPSTQSGVFGLFGPLLGSTSVDIETAVEEIAYGLPENIVQIQFGAQGPCFTTAYGPSPIGTAPNNLGILRNYLKMAGGVPWLGPRVRLVQYKVALTTASGFSNYPYINIVVIDPDIANPKLLSLKNSQNGWPLSQSGVFVKSGCDIDPANALLNFEGSIDISTTASDTSASDLNGVLVGVTE